jgi:hypothetical protein
MFPQRLPIMATPMRRTLLLTIAFISTLAIPALARASSPDSSHVAQFNLSAPNGLAVSVLGGATAKTPASGFVNLTVVKLLAKDGFGISTATYSVKASVTARRIHANLRPFGEIDVRFHPRGKPHAQFVPVCKGTSDTSQPGVFEGRIRFRGESGYVRVNATTARGQRDTLGPFHCGKHGHISRSTADRSEKVERVVLGALTKDRDLSFSATELLGETPSRFSPGAPVVNYAASAEQPCRRIHISRTISVEGSASSFVFDSPLTAATVTPPSPFSGNASFGRDALTGRISWAGTLRASFLGATRRLANNGFTASLKRDRVDPSTGTHTAYLERCGPA